MDLFFLCMYVHGEFSLFDVNFLPGFTISLFLRNIATDWAKALSLVWEKVLFYTEIKFFLLITFSGTVFKLQG